MRLRDVLIGLGVCWHVVSCFAQPSASLAVSPDHVVTATPGEIAWYDKDGLLQGSIPLYGSNGLWTDFGASDSIQGPQVVWNSAVQRFYVAAIHVVQETQFEVLLQATTIFADPDDGWATGYQSLTPIGYGATNLSLGTFKDGAYAVLDMTESNGSWLIGFSRENVLQSTNQGITIAELWSTAKTYTASESSLDINDDLIALSPRSSYSTRIRLAGLRQTQFGPYITHTDISTPYHTAPPNVGLVLTGDDAFTSFQIVGDEFWAAHTSKASDRPVVRWYNAKLNGWPNSGDHPDMIQQGEFGGDAFAPAISGGVIVYNSAEGAGLCVVVRDAVSGSLITKIAIGPQSGLWQYANAIHNDGDSVWVFYFTGDGYTLQRLVLAPGFGDVNRDGVVDTADMGLVISEFGIAGESVCDLNNDGVVDTADLGMLIAEFD